MYGTVTHLRFQAGVDPIRVLQSQGEAPPIPGFLFQYIYRPEADPQVVILVAGFESKAAYEAYTAHADRSAQTESYRALLADNPEVTSGEIIGASSS